MILRNERYRKVRPAFRPGQIGGEVRVASCGEGLEERDVGRVLESAGLAGEAEAGILLDSRGAVEQYCARHKSAARTREQAASAP